MKDVSINFFTKIQARAVIEWLRSNDISFHCEPWPDGDVRMVIPTPASYKIKELKIATL